MIRADELVREQVYYVAISFEVVTRTYVGSLPGDEHRVGGPQQPVYIFVDANRRPIKQYGIDLLTYFSVEADALKLVMLALNSTLQIMQDRYEELTNGEV